MARPMPLLPDLTRRDWTVERVNALSDDGNRYEVIDGELLVTPARSFVHQRTVLRLARLLAPYTERQALECFVAPTAVTFSARREVQPDLLVIPTLDGPAAASFSDVGRLILAVEVVSSSTALADRYAKRRLFQSEQVPEYWIVDPGARMVERWHPLDESPEILLDALVWQPSPMEGPFVLDLPDFFRKVHGE